MIGERRKARGHPFLFWPLAARHRCCRSLVFLLPSHRSHRTLAKFPELMTPQLLMGRRWDSPTRLASRNPGTRSPSQLSNDFPHRNRPSKIASTVWSHREPAARQSSPAHPRSWQLAGSPLVSRPGQKVPGALPTLHIQSYIITVDWIR